MVGNLSPGDAEDRTPLARLVALTLLLLIDTGTAVLIGGMLWGSLRGGEVLGDTPALYGTLLLADGALVAGAVIALRRGRSGLALGLAAVPAVLVALATALLFYLLSHMGPHH